MTGHVSYDARAVANLLLDIADQRKVPLTQVSLLKLIYFSHGWFLAETGCPLVEQEFEAWEYGPVVKVVRDAFKSFGDAPISCRAMRLDIFTGTRSVVEPNLSEEDRKFILTVFDAYHIHDAWKLSNMTHEKGSPWDIIWNSTKPLGRLALRIRNGEIKQHFDGLPKRFRLS